MELPEASVAGAVEREIAIAAPPSVVFAHLTDPERMCLWKGVAAELEPRPGGTYRVDMNGRDVVRGEYVEVVPYSRVVFTWGWEDAERPLAPGTSTVEVTLQPRDGGTLLRLRHTGLPAENRQSHAEGWDHYMPRLRVAAEGGDAGPDPWLAASALEPAAPAAERRPQRGG